ncbi:hypothetical protein DOTSEDRAFT_80789 [Dothistroma septosporum NZE10]|uniref:Uncharacterized protein n=1 Tax=Dothistroma septosporum (strain NZE10 / CBS 128990) TaxID=675120 RepID=M2YN43_DOTSN|nr:hypothetical protein DOTSEDRAFT_80789 [Dothistroma septosporum NZE10]
MANSLAAHQYESILKLIRQKMDLRSPRVASRPHCHCPDCGRIIATKEEYELADDVFDHDDDDDEDEAEDEEDDAEPGDRTDEAQFDADYLDILSEIRNLMRDPFDGSGKAARALNVMFDLDLIERHAGFGGGRRKTRSRTKVLMAQRVKPGKTIRMRDNGELADTPSLTEGVREPMLLMPSSESTASYEGHLDNADELDATAQTAASRPAPCHRSKTRPIQLCRPMQRGNSTTETAVDTSIVTAHCADEASSPVCRSTMVCVGHPHLVLFLRMFGDPAITVTSRARTSFNDIVAAMRNADFMIEQSGRCAGSAVTFKDYKHLYNGRSITFHRPHPEPRVPQHLLRKWGKRLSDVFGWSAKSFVAKS